MVTIETERLILRQFTPRDLDGLYQFYRSPKCIFTGK